MMSNRIGKFLTKRIGGESYQAYLPPALPLKPPVRTDELSGLLEKAASALAELNGLSKVIPNISLFIYMNVRKEAVLSSQIEGTQSSLSDLMLFERHQKPSVSLEDVEEVSNYVKAIQYGLSRLRDDFPLSLRLLREIHAVLMSGIRGQHMQPGQFRLTQNWIGGTRAGNALFVPPPVEHLQECLSNLELFLHDDRLPVLIKAGIAHLQFETIHPFLDGNGRLGRLLIILLLVENNLLAEPVLYLSLYLKKNRQLYYKLLQEVRMQGTWETWLEFFLEGVVSTSMQAINTAKAINELFESDASKIARLGRARFSCEQIFEYLKKLPQVTVPLLTDHLDLSAPAIRNALKQLLALNIVEESTGKKRGKIYVYKGYLELLEAED